MKGKNDKQFLFETQLQLAAKTQGNLVTKETKNNITVSTPLVFGGEGNHWCAETLLLSSISSSFMSTYLSYAKKQDLIISKFECETIGQIEIIKNKYKFTHINLYPKIFIKEESLKEKAKIALKKTHKNCLITNSLDAIVFYHSEIIVEKKKVAKVK